MNRFPCWTLVGFMVCLTVAGCHTPDRDESTYISRQNSPSTSYSAPAPQPTYAAPSPAPTPIPRYSAPQGSGSRSYLSEGSGSR